MRCLGTGFGAFGGEDPLGPVPLLGTPAALAEDLVEGTLDQSLTVDPARPILVLLTERLGQVIGQQVLDAPPFDTAITACGCLERIVPGQLADGRELEGLRGVDSLVCRDRGAAGRRRRRAERVVQLSLEARPGTAGARRASVRAARGEGPP